MDESYKLKIAVISGASKAVKFKAENPRATDSEVIRYVTNSVEEILAEIDEE